MNLGLKFKQVLIPILYKLKTCINFKSKVNLFKFFLNKANKNILYTCHGCVPKFDP